MLIKIFPEPNTPTKRFIANKADAGLSKNISTYNRVLKTKS